MTTKTIIDHVLVLHGLAAYAIVGALCFGEAAVLVGFVLPGETAVITGGLLASQNKVSLAVMAVVVVAAAIAGDSVGFEMGRRFGPWFLARPALARRAGAIDRGRSLIQRHGGLAIFLGRFTAVFRAMVPGLAGMSGVTYSRFLPANVAGGVIWGVGYTLLGYLVGTTVESISGQLGAVLLGAVIVGLGARGWLMWRRREPASPQPMTQPAPGKVEIGSTSGPR